MLQLLLSDWIVRFFLLYLIVVGGLVFIRRESQVESSPFLRLRLADLRDRCSDDGTWRAAWWDAYNLRDKCGIRIGLAERNGGAFWRNSDGLHYA